MADDSDSDSSFGEIPLCDAPVAQHKPAVEIAPPPSESLEASTARRERAEKEKRDAAEAKERAEAQERARARITAEAEAAKRREAAEPPSEGSATSGRAGQPRPEAQGRQARVVRSERRSGAGSSGTSATGTRRRSASCARRRTATRWATE